MRGFDERLCRKVDLGTNADGYQLQALSGKRIAYRFHARDRCRVAALQG